MLTGGRPVKSDIKPFFFLEYNTLYCNCRVKYMNTLRCGFMLNGETKYYICHSLLTGTHRWS